MKREKLEINTALQQGMQLPFALIRTWSIVYLGKCPVQMPQLDELLEARFFGKNREIRIFRREGDMHAVSLEQTPEDRTLEETYELESKFGKALTVCRHLSVDEDGQTVFIATRLSFWEGA